MFFEAEIKKVGSEDYDVLPMIKDIKGRAGVIKGVKQLQIAGGEVAIDFKFKVGDKVLVGLASYNLTGEVQDVYSQGVGFANAFILCKIYKEVPEDELKLSYNNSSVRIKDKIMIKNQVHSFIDLIEEFINIFPSAFTITALGNQPLDGATIIKLNALKTKFKGLFE